MNSEYQGWFAGPKAENGDWFESLIHRIFQDYYSWRRNYFPDDGMVIDASLRKSTLPFQDSFEDKLTELLAKLKADFPFHSPRYAAHMISEQTLPSIAGYIAAMLYNPNNVSREAAPVTVRLELEACRLISNMIGFDKSSWTHLTGGGTVANLEALWVARTVAYLPKVNIQMRQNLGLSSGRICTLPQHHLQEFADIFCEARERGINMLEVIESYKSSDYCIVENGLHEVSKKDSLRPVILVPESHHYSFEKILDVLGIGRKNLMSVPVDKDFRMRMDALSEILDKTKSESRIIAVVSVVGSTEEGAIDPINEVLQLRNRMTESGENGFWLHVDGAFGGYLRTLTVPSKIGLGERKTRTRLFDKDLELDISLPENHACDALETMGQVDSVTIDPHKLGYVPYPAGAICFKTNLVKPLLRQEAAYIETNVRSLEEERDNQAIGVYVFEGSKPGAAAAAVWLSHTLIPLDNEGHGQLVKQTIRNACELHSLLLIAPEMNPKLKSIAVPLASPGSNVVCFAFRPTNNKISLKHINQINQNIYDRFTVIDESNNRMYGQKFFVSRTKLNSSQYGRDAVSDFLTRMGSTYEDYEVEGVFLLRCVLMNPWYELSKQKNRYFLGELVEELFRVADETIANQEANG